MSTRNISWGVKAAGAIGALAVPVLRFSFGIINWRIEEIKK